MTAGTRIRGLALVAGLLVSACGGGPTATGTAAQTELTSEPSTTLPASPSATLPASAPVATPTAAVRTSAPAPTPTESTMPTEFSLASPAFVDGAPIPKRFTCEGADVSPTLTWEGAPDGTLTLALIVDDPDAPGGTFVHWVAYDIDGVPNGGLAEGISRSSDAPAQGRNDFGKIGYGGPCPPAGEIHHYRFVLYALDRTLGLGGAPTAGQLRAAMKGHILVQARLVGTYRR